MSRLEDLPLGGIRDTDHLNVIVNDSLCSRCREMLAEHEVPILLWPSPPADSAHRVGDLLYQYCQRCAFDPDSDRCKKCGCTERTPCDEGCGWAAPGLCAECTEASQ